MPGKIDVQRILENQNDNQDVIKSDRDLDPNNSNQEPDSVKDHIREILDDILNPKNN